MSPPATLLLTATPKVDAFLRGVQNGTPDGEPADPTRLIGLLLLVMAVLLAAVALKGWGRRPSKAKPLHSHKKLLAEVAVAAPVSNRQFQALAEMGDRSGVVSPLVAIVCPSVLQSLAAQARTDEHRQTLADVARRMAQDAGSGPQAP